MTRLTASQVRGNFSDIVNRVAYQGERVVLERRGRPLAALVPIEDFDALEADEDRADIEAAHQAEREAKAVGETPIPWTEARERLGL